MESFFTNIGREYSARSGAVSSMVSLNYEDFFTIIKEFPSDYEEYCLIRDKMQLYGAT